MDAQNIMVDEKVLKQLVKDIGVDYTRKFIDSLDKEYQKRINSIRQAIEEESFKALAAEAHALKSTAQVSGAYKLADLLIQLEIAANDKNDEAISMAREALTIADLTRFAYLDIKLSN